VGGGDRVIGGAARLRFEDEAVARHLVEGDWVDIAPHRRHRVDWTAPEVATIWLAVFYR
jgi:cupin 2 domain-containing protein